MSAQPRQFSMFIPPRLAKAGLPAVLLLVLFSAGIAEDRPAAPGPVSVAIRELVHLTKVELLNAGDVLREAAPADHWAWFNVPLPRELQGEITQ